MSFILKFESYALFGLSIPLVGKESPTVPSPKIKDWPVHVHCGKHQKKRLTITNLS